MGKWASRAHDTLPDETRSPRGLSTSPPSQPCLQASATDAPALQAEAASCSLRKGEDPVTISYSHGVTTRMKRDGTSSASQTLSLPA